MKLCDAHWFLDFLPSHFLPKQSLRGEHLLDYSCTGDGSASLNLEGSTDLTDNSADILILFHNDAQRRYTYS